MEGANPDLSSGEGATLEKLRFICVIFSFVVLLCDGGACIVSVEETLSKSVADVGHCSVLLITLADSQPWSGLAGGGLVDCRVHETSTP